MNEKLVQIVRDDPENVYYNQDLTAALPLLLLSTSIYSLHIHTKSQLSTTRHHPLATLTGPVRPRVHC